MKLICCFIFGRHGGHYVGVLQWYNNSFLYYIDCLDRGSIRCHLLSHKHHQAPLAQVRSPTAARVSLLLFVQSSVPRTNDKFNYIKLKHPSQSFAVRTACPAAAELRWAGALPPALNSSFRFVRIFFFHSFSCAAAYFTLSARSVRFVSFGCYLKINLACASLPRGQSKSTNTQHQSPSACRRHTENTEFHHLSQQA